MSPRKRNPLAFADATSARFTTLAALILAVTIIFSRGLLESPAPNRWTYVLVRLALALAWLSYALSLYYGMRILLDLSKGAEDKGETEMASSEAEDTSEVTSPPLDPQDDSSAKTMAGERRESLAGLLSRQLRSFLLGTLFLVLTGILLLASRPVLVEGVYYPPSDNPGERCLDCKQLQTTVNNVTKDIDFNLKTLVAKFDPKFTLRQEFDFALKAYLEPKFDLHLQKIEQLSRRIEQLNQTNINRQTNINVRINRNRRRKRKCECPAAAPKPPPATSTED